MLLKRRFMASKTLDIDDPIRQYQLQQFALSQVPQPKFVPPAVNTVTVTDSATGVVLNAGSSTATYTITVPDNMIMQSFLATSFCSVFNFPATFIRFSVLRNGVNLTNQQIDLPIWQATYSSAGQFFVEVLGFLTGTVLRKGETFQFVVFLSPSGAQAATLNNTLTLTGSYIP